MADYTLVNFDEVERLAVHRAKALFGARYANVQPHSCSSANLAVLAALVPPGGTLLGLGLDAGGRHASARFDHVGGGDSDRYLLRRTEPGEHVDEGRRRCAARPP